MVQESPLHTYLSNYVDMPPHRNALQPVFQQIGCSFNPRRVLYPGSWLDVTPSLYFPDVCYVDSLTGISDSLADPDLRKYIFENRNYPDVPRIQCYHQDYRTFTSEPEESFDLLISLNAGFISQACKRFIPSGGLLLVNDEHYDARRAFVDADYSFIAVFIGENLRIETSEAKLASYFKTAGGTRFNPEMVEADAPRSPSRARHKPSMTASVYLFRRC